MTPPQAAVLVPLDGSKNAECALPMAVLLAQAYDAPLRLVHVAEKEAVPSAKEFDRAVETFAAYASELAARFGAKDRFSADLFLGSPASTVLENTADALCVVLASHGRGGFRATFIGSVADKIVRGASVPVLVVPAIDGSEAARLGTVVVALDGSEEAEAGLAAARELAGKTGAKVILVRAYSTPPAVGMEFAYYPPDLVDSLAEAAREYLQGISRPGEEAVLVHGPAADVVIQTAEDRAADLVVMTSRGKGLAGRLALGSTTDRVIHTLHRPILVVHAVTR